MKWRILFAFVFVFALFALAPVARADSPSDAAYAIAAYTGMTIDQVVSVERQWDDLQGRVRNLTTDAAWKADYAGRTNDFAALLGVPRILEENSNDGTLTFAGRILMQIGKAEYAGKFQ